MKQTFSEDDAQRIFALAAERQQRSPDPGREALSLDDLLEAGRAAGIDPEHIRAAATDLMRPERLPVQRSLFGVPTEVRVTRVFSGTDFEQVWKDGVERMRGYSEHQGVEIPVENGKVWKSVGDGDVDTNGRLQLLVEREDAGVRVTIERNRMLPFGGSLFGAGLFLAVAVAISIQGLVAGTIDSLAVALLFSAISASIGGSAWFISKRVGRQDASALPQILAELERVAGDRMDDALDKPEDEKPGTVETPLSPLIHLPDADQLAATEAPRRASRTRRSK